MTETGKMELLPCPFCGSEQLKISPNVYDGLLRVKCEGCWATSVCSNQRATVIKSWNTRAALSSEAALREALKAVNTALLQICDGSNWPEHVQQGVGYECYSEITEQLHDIANEITTALASHPIPAQPQEKEEP